MTGEAQIDDRKLQARRWFESLQARIVAAFESIENDAPGPFAPEAGAPGRFELKPWSRIDTVTTPGV